MAVPLSVFADGGPYDVIYRVGTDEMGFLTSGPAQVNQVSSFAPPIRVGGSPAYSDETYQQFILDGFNEGGDRLLFETGDRRYQWSDGQVALHRDDVITLASAWESSDAAKAATARAILDFNPSTAPQPWILYAYGTTLRAYNTSTGVWADAHPAAGVFGASITHINVIGAQMYISFGSALNTYYWDGASLTTTFSDWGIKSNCIISGSIGTTAIWRALAGSIYSYVTGVGFGAAVPVGYASTTISDLYETGGLLFIAKPEGLYTYDGTTVRRLMAADITSATNNFRGLTEWLNTLYLPWLNALYKGVVNTSSTITKSDITPTMKGDTAKERYGHGMPIKVIAGPRKLFVALDDGEGLYPEVLSYDGMGYQQVYRGTSGDTMRAMGYSRQMDYLLINDGATRIKKLINSGDSEYPNFAASGEFWTPKLDAGFPGENKAFRSIEIETADCLATKEYVTISYRLDGGSWVPTTAVETNGKKEVVLDSVNGHVVGKTIEFKFVLTRTTGVTSTPKIKLPMIVRMMVIPEPIDAYSESLNLKLSEMLHNGYGRLSNAGYTVQQMLDFLNMARASAYPLQRTDEYGRTYMVRMTNKTERPSRLTDASDKYEIMVSFVDLAPGLNWQDTSLATKFIMTATTATPAETVTLQRITPGIDSMVYWGDGSTDTILAANVATTTHVYANAGTYTVTVKNPASWTYLDLRDTRLTVNSDQIAKCIAVVTLRDDCKGIFTSADLSALPLTSLHVDLPLGGTYTFSSSHIAAMALTYLCVLMNQVGTYTFDSSHIAAMALTYLCVLMNRVGTYTFDSSHIAAMALTYLYIYMTQVGTYTFDSSHIAAMSALTEIYIILHSVNTFTIAQADWDGFPNCIWIQVLAALTQGNVDNLLLGLYAGFATKTATNGTIDVGGTNAAPSGIYQAQCPPVTGKEAAYELINDSCGVSSKHWISVTTA